MFTGIVDEMGKVARTRPDGLTLAIPPRMAARLSPGGSIAVEGVCLTATAVRSGEVDADIMPETFAKTTLGSLRDGDAVNLELPATPESLLAGHIVQGHVDGVATVAAVEERGNSRMVSFSLSPELARYIAQKGSVAVNGVSLTVVEAAADGFSVALIPHTRQVTTLSDLRVGSKANIETDILAKYAEKLLASR